MAAATTTAICGPLLPLFRPSHPFLSGLFRSWWQTGMFVHTIIMVAAGAQNPPFPQLFLIFLNLDLRRTSSILLYFFDTRPWSIGRGIPASSTVAHPHPPFAGHVFPPPFHVVFPLGPLSWPSSPSPFPPSSQRPSLGSSSSKEGFLSLSLSSFSQEANVKASTE